MAQAAVAADSTVAVKVLQLLVARVLETTPVQTTRAAAVSQVAVVVRVQVVVVRLLVHSVVAAARSRDASRSARSVKSSSRCRLHRWVAYPFHAVTATQ